MLLARRCARVRRNPLVPSVLGMVLRSTRAHISVILGAHDRRSKTSGSCERLGWNGYGADRHSESSMPYRAAGRSEQAVGQRDTARAIGRTHALLCSRAVAAELDVTDRKAVGCTRPSRRTVQRTPPGETGASRARASLVRSCRVWRDMHACTQVSALSASVGRWCAKGAVSVTHPRRMTKLAAVWARRWVPEWARSPVTSLSGCAPTTDASEWRRTARSMAACLRG